MTLLSVFFKDKRGGLIERLYHLSRYVVSEKHELHFISAEPLPFQDNRVLQHIVNIPFSNRENLFFWVCFCLATAANSWMIVRRRRINAAFTFAPFYTALLVLAIIIYRIPVVTFIRADNLKHSGNLLRNILFYIVDWIGIKLTDKVIFVSQTLKEVYQKRYSISAEKISVLRNNIIENGVEIDDERKRQMRASLGVSDREFLVTTIGVLNEGKNISLLIRALHHLSGDQIKLAIIGDEVVPNGERARLEELSRSLGLQEKVIFCGWQDSPLPLIASSDLFVYPSKHEGCPNALLEALGCGVPCIASRIPEIREILHYDELLFSLDCPEELSGKMLRVLDDPDYRLLLLALCKERVSVFSFDWEKAALEHIADEAS